VRKLDRLREIERLYGPEFVLPYRACYDWPQIEAAVEEFWKTGHTPSLRTDWRATPEQGYGLPFVHPGVSLVQAALLYEQWADKLVYIVCEGVSHEQALCNVAAQRLGPALFLVEWDHGGCAQRAWEQTCMELQSAFVGLGDEVPGCDIPPWGWQCVRRPRHLPARTAAEQMLDLIVSRPEGGDPLTVWTVRQDGRIVIW